MDLNKILKMNPKSECKITYDGYYQWGGVHFQNKGSNELDVNTLPLLDEKYNPESNGKPLVNDKYQEVFDPTQEIEYDPSLEIPWGYVYTSKTFIGLLQKKLNQFIDEQNPDLDDEYAWEEFIEFLGCTLGWRSLVEDLDVECKDLKLISEYDEEDTYLWYTADGMDAEGGELIIEEL